MMPVSAIFWPLSAIFLAVESSTAHSYRGESGTPVSDAGPILRHRSGPSSQLSGPIAGFLACVEDAQRLRLPSAPAPRRGPTGLHRTQFAKIKKILEEKSNGTIFFLDFFLFMVERIKTLVYALSEASMEWLN